MKNNASLVYAVLLVLGDFLALVGAFTAAYILRVKFDPRPLLEQIPALNFLYAFLAVLPVWIVIHIFIGLYNQDVYEKRFSELGRLMIGSFLGILVFIGYDFVSNDSLFPARLVPVYGLFLGFSFLVIFRTTARTIRQLLFQYNVGISNIILIGDTDATSEIARIIGDSRSSGQRIIATVGRRIHKVPCYESFKSAVEGLREQAHGVVQTELYKSQQENNDILRYCQERHVSYRFMPGNSDMFVGNIAVELFAELPVIAVHQTALIGWGRVVKRIFDLVVAILLVVILSPVYLLTAVTILVVDRRGGVFFKQTRLTRFNREFKVYKFRTLKQRYNGLSPEEGFELMGKPGLSKKYRANGDHLLDDPRLSSFGRFMRLTSLDELPQFFNVIKGDLSLVGPRALVPQELDTYSKKHTILSVKSGITGLAQVSGRRDISFEERRKLDTYYVQNWSFWLDITIMLRTLRAVVTGSGAK